LPSPFFEYRCWADGAAGVAEAGQGSAERCVLGFRHSVGHGGLACCALEAGWDFG